MPGLIPLWPRPGASETLEWLTDVMISENGTEERTEMRVAPRQAVRFDFFIPLDQRANIANLIYGGRTGEWYVPIWQQVQRVGVLVAGEDEIDCETRYSEFRVGGLALLWESTGHQELVEIEAVTSATLLTITAPHGAFADAWLMPVRLGHLASNPSRAFNGRTSELSLSFEISDLEELAPAAPAQYLGADIYFEPGLLDGGRLVEAIEARVDVMDESLGLVGYHAPWLYPRPTRQHRMMAEDAVGAWAIREFLHRRRGRAIPFWLPTFESDFRILSTGTISTSISVSADSFLAYAAARVHVAIETPGGWVAREITDANDLGGGVVQLILDTTLGGIPASDIKCISHMGLRRLAADRAEINSLGGTVFDCGVATVEIEP